MLVCRLIFYRCILVVLATSLSLIPAQAAEDSAVSETLTIGSKAPDLDVEHWLSTGKHDFDKVTDFKEDKVYVVEFWATWCGPCISSMPHLVEIQERHAKDGVQIVSISNEDIETVERFLKRDVRKRGASKKKVDEDAEEEKPTYADLTSGYCLTTDPDRSSHDAYMKAAGQNGIPCSFIVGKAGVIEWIGHPMSMDKPLQAVIDNDWDRETFAKEFKQKQAISLLLSRTRSLVRKHEFDDALELLAEAKEDATGRNKQMIDFYHTQYYNQKLQYMARNGETEEALELLEADIDKASDAEQMSLKKLRVDVLLGADRNEDAAEALTDIVADLSPTGLNQVAWSIYEKAKKSKDPIEPKLLAIAIEAAEAAADKAPKQGANLDTLAHLLHLKGDTERALEVQTKALEFAGRARPQIEAFLKELKAESSDDTSDE